jgi:heavy metal sensor kinase
VALPIRARLTIWYSVALVLIVIVLGGFLFIRLRADLTRGLDATLTSRARQISLQLPSGNFEDTADASVLASLPKSSDLAQILSSDGRVLQTSGNPKSDASLVPASILKAARSRAVHGTVPVGPDAEPYRVLAIPVGSARSVLVVASSLEDVENATRRLLIQLAFAIPVAVALSALGGYLLTRRALGPVDRMTQAAAAIGADDIGARLAVPAIEDEVGRLGRTLNQMLARLHGAIEQQRRFTADASHELRTPLSIMRSELDVAIRSPQTSEASRAVLESARDEVSRMSRIVEDLMTLARIDEGAYPLSRARIDLSALSRDVTDRFKRSADDKKITTSFDGEPVVVPVDEALVGQLVANLIDNAVKYTPEGGSIGVSVRRNGRAARVAVQNSGSSISDEDRSRVFERFYRIDKARSRSSGGAGLGLSICKWIAEAHGGTITVQSDPAAGTTFIVSLPLGEGQS